MSRVFELIDYYIWRINLLRCLIKHDYKISYTRISMDGRYSGELGCSRCFKHEYFSGPKIG